MEVSCTSCPARFAVPDDKVRGRKVRIACKRCGSPIIVDGTTLGGGAPAAAKPAAAPAVAPKPAPAAPKPAPAPAAPKPAPAPAPAAPKPAPAPAAAPKPAPAPAAAPKPAPAPAAAPKPAPAPAAAPKPAPAPAAPKPAPAPAPAAPKPAASGLPAFNKPAAKAEPVPRPGLAAPRPPAAAKPAEDDNDWSALSDDKGKPGAWREPASVPRPVALPPPSSVGTPKIGGFAKRTMLGGLEAPRGAAPAPPTRDKLGTATGPRSAPSAPKPAPASGARPADKEESEPEWTVALTDDQHEEMRTAEVVQLYARGSIDQETFIWADGMEDWKRPWEIPMIAAALSARGLKPKAPSESDHHDTDFPMDEPEEEDATIVATMGAFGPPSSRGRAKEPSGVWREPGRDQDDVGFEDVTVSLDGASAQNLLKGLAGEPARPPQKSKPELLAAQFDDVPTRIQDEQAELPPPSAHGQDVDDLLSDMEERTLAMQEDFIAQSRPMSAADLLNDDDDNTVEQQRRVSAEPLAFAATMMGQAPVGLPAAEPPAQNLFAGVDLPPPPGRERPLDSLWEPTGIQQASSPAASSGAYPLVQPVPVSMPGPMMQPRLPEKKSRVGCVLGVLFLFVLVAGALAGSFITKQPPSLYGPDGMPKIPGLTR